jgi:cation transport ATPase
VTTTEAGNAVELVIGGMTCASCAACIEKKLNKLDGVTASVNYATEKATVRFADAVQPEELIATVEATGYTASVPSKPARERGEQPDLASDTWRRLIISTMFAMPVVLLAMVRPLQFANWQRVALVLAIEASDLTLVRGDLRAAADAIRLSRATLRTIRGNLFWAFAYNIAALPLAAAGLLNPLIAGAAMAFSSVFVVSNSLRLRRYKPADC